jgi:UrcA family protein
MSISSMNGGEARIHAGLTILAAMCGIALTTAAGAEDSFSEPLTAVVSYADLNLNGEPGAKEMYARLRAAARKVCAPLEGRGAKKITWGACVDQAIARAIGEVDKPALTAYHSARSGETEARLALEEQ